MMAGFLSPTRGELLLGDRRITGPGSDRGVVFQKHALLPWLNVIDNTAFGLMLQGVGKQERYRTAARNLELVGLQDFHNHMIYQLSGGMQQRVGIARALTCMNFWASWCYPACYEEAPVLERGWRAWKDRGVVVIGVDIQDKEEAARNFLKQLALTFPNGPDPTGKVSVDYGVYGVPETFFIDKTGRIRKKHVGAVTDEIFNREAERLVRDGS